MFSGKQFSYFISAHIFIIKIYFDLNVKCFFFLESLSIFFIKTAERLAEWRLVVASWMAISKERLTDSLDKS